MPPAGGWKSGIYCFRNKINGKRYVGSGSSTIRSRFLDHRFRLRTNIHGNQYLQNAWNKYGEEAFEFDVLERVKPTLCVIREQYWIDRFQSANPRYGYNICPTAGSRLGVKLSPETCAEFSERSKVVMNQPHVVAKLSAATTEAMKDPELRRILSEAAIRRYENPEERIRSSELAKECQNRPEVKEKRAETLKRPEVRAKLSEAIKLSWAANPDREVYRPDWNDPEYRKTQSESMRIGKRQRVDKKIERLTVALTLPQFTVEDIRTAAGYRSSVGARKLLKHMLERGLVRCLLEPSGRAFGQYAWVN